MDKPRQIHSCLTVLGITSSPVAAPHYAAPAGYGDEGKWYWMARISGDAEQRLIKEGFITPLMHGPTKQRLAHNTSGTWTWNDKGLNCTVEELMNYAEVQYCNQLTSSGITATPDVTATTPTYLLPHTLQAPNYPITIRRLSANHRHLLN